jgi:hypothetical protein
VYRVDGKGNVGELHGGQNEEERRGAAFARFDDGKARTAIIRNGRDQPPKGAFSITYPVRNSSARSGPKRR